MQVVSAACSRLPGGIPVTVSREQLLPSVRMMYRSALRGQLRGLQAD